MKTPQLRPFFFNLFDHISVHQKLVLIPLKKARVPVKYGDIMAVSRMDNGFENNFDYPFTRVPLCGKMPVTRHIEPVTGIPKIVTNWILLKWIPQAKI